MRLKLSLGSLALCAAFGLSACSSGSSTSANSETSSTTIITSSASTGGGSTTSGILPATANTAYPAGLYTT